MRILTYCAAYLPGYKTGGPLRSLVGLVQQLGPEFEFWIVTADRDLGDRKPYADVTPSRWLSCDGSRLYYAKPSEFTPMGLRSITASVRPHLSYVNSFFSPKFSMLPIAMRRLRLASSAPMLLAPRGEFSPGALGIKATKKAAFLAIARRLAAYNDLTWQASTSLEADDIRRQFPNARIIIAGNLATPLPAEHCLTRPGKRVGAVSLAFVSRITPMKNLSFALNLLHHVRGNVDYHIYGPIEDANYGIYCQTEAARLPPNIRVNFHGDIAHEDVHGELARHHGFLLPTLGENFGHAILEALLAGCVTIIGDQTPWRELEQRGAGWALPVTNKGVFVDAIQRMIDMDEITFTKASANARTVGLERATSAAIVDENRALFRSAANAPKRWRRPEAER